ncbi:MAG TPA: patatin-like phospholipase family protein [Solirubrobacteraceae bacterium]|nr:patatin-like phospholipase family protein [Solirubrobacteraceae bacterium]
MSETNGNGTGTSGVVAAVLPGGGARGAYEIGALSVLLPALEARGERVEIWCGTSVGAINAATLSSLAHLPAPEQVELALTLWDQLNKQDVISPIAGIGGLRMLGRLLGHVLGVAGIGIASLLDAAPLGGSLDRWIDWHQLAANVDAGAVRAVCVIATSLATGDPVAFVDSRSGAPKHVDDTIRYVTARLSGEHVRASAAIPMLFPTVEVTAPREARGHYADGGTRLNSPIKPALNLGADKVIVIGLEPFAAAGGRPSPPRGPSIADVAANVLDGLLVDQVAQDLRRLAMINSFFVEDAVTGTMRSPRAYRLARGHEPYRPISYALVAPRRRGAIGKLAEEVFARRYGGWRGLRDLDYVVMARALGGATPARGELLSFLLFDHVFISELIAMGRRDANRWLRRHPRFWCRDASHDLSMTALDRGSIKEQDALDEFRSQHRRL